MGGKASATPELLRKYANGMTGACGDLAAWVRGPLAASIVEYRKGAVDHGAGVLSGYGAIDMVVSQILDKVWATDKNVDVVATLFEIAGSKGDLRPGDPLSLLTLNGQPTGPQAVISTDDAVENADYKAGLGLGGNYPGLEGIINFASLRNDPKFQQFANNPDFFAGILNKITENQKGVKPPDDFGKINWKDPQTAQAVALAFRSGQLSAETKDRLLWALLNANNGGQVPSEFFKALAADPVAAKNFVDKLQGDPEKFKLFLQGRGWGPWQPGFHPPGTQGQWIGELYKVFGGALPEMSKADVKKLIETVGTSLPKTIGRDEFLAAEPGLKAFIQAAVPRLLDPLVLKSGNYKDMEAWIIKYAQELSVLEPIVEYVMDKYKNYHDVDKAGSNIVFDLVVGGAFRSVPGGDIATPFLNVVILDKLKDAMAKAVAPPDAPDADFDPKRYSNITALSAVIAQLAQSNRISVDGKIMTLDQLANDPNFEKLLRAFGADEPPKDIAQDAKKLAKWNAEKQEAIKWANKNVTIDNDVTLYTIVSGYLGALDESKKDKD